MIRVTDLTKVFHGGEADVTALSGINLTVGQGDIFGIIGMSGAGKSTLLRCIALLEMPTEGKIEVEGVDISKLQGKELTRLRKSIGVIGRLKPNVVFSKGGFVAVPVVLAARHFKIPTIIHESDMTPGLANKICIPSAAKVCCNFPETLSSLPAGKAVLTGSPIRQELLSGDKYRAREFLHFTSDKPVILVVGGSLGAVAVNNAIRAILPELLKDFQVIHLCGRGKLDPSLNGTEGYAQFEYIKEELRDLFALTDIVISRAGANAICELLALHKPNLLIPLSANASRGDQILNARSFERQGFSMVLEEEELTNETLLTAVHDLYDNREKYIDAMKHSSQQDSIDTIIDLIESVTA